MTRITWGEGVDSVPVYPWDDASILISRIGKKTKIPARFIRLRTNIQPMIRSSTGDETITIQWDNLLEEWTQIQPLWKKPIVLIVGEEEDDQIAFLRSRWNEITEPVWDQHFQHQFPEISHQEMGERIQKQENADADRQDMHDKASQTYKTMIKHNLKEEPSWSTKTHRIQYVVPDDRGTDHVFQELRLSPNWIMSVLHKKTFDWAEKEFFFTKTRRMKDPNISALWNEGLLVEEIRRKGLGIFLYAPNQPPVMIRQKDRKHIVVEVEGDVPFDQIQLAIMNQEPPVEQLDVGMVGDMVFGDMYVDMTLLQDTIMNDPVASLFLWVDESRRLFYENKLPVHLTPLFCNLLGVSSDADLLFQNVHRQKEYQVVVLVKTPITEQSLPIFTRVMSHVMARHAHLADDLLTTYNQFIPSFKETMEKRKNALVSKQRKPDYITKYPRLFVSSIYRSICQLACQPEMLQEDEIAGIPADRLLRFPPEKVEEINPEYYFCPNEDYPYAGLKEMKGPKVFMNVAPCCYNSPQTKENARKLKNIFAELVEKGGKGKKDNIIKGKLLIKNVGQLGEIRPPSLRRFLMSYNFAYEYYRIGTRRSASSLIACLMQHRRLTRLVEDREDDEQVRTRIANDPSCVEACLQENPGLTTEEIKKDMLDMSLYFDPRRFYRAVEIFFRVRLIVFTKPRDEKQGEDATIMTPVSMRSHYSCHNTSATIIIFEHWGGRTNLVAGFPYAHCELIGFKPKLPDKPEIVTDFSDPTLCKTFQKSVLQIVDNLRYDFDGSFPIFAYDRKHCWFDRHIIGQTLDPIGKVRWLHFEYNRKLFSALVDPPMPVLQDVPIAPKNTGVPDAVRMRNFMLSFKGWEIHVPHYGSDIIFWSVRQDDAMWKSLEEKTPVRLTFACRLPAPRPEELEQRGGILQKVIHVGGSSSLCYTNLFETIAAPPTAMNMEKVARILSDLAVHNFSLFLRENKVMEGAVNPDELMNTFYSMRVVIDPSHEFSLPYQPSRFVRRDRLILPSIRFWKKIEFHLRWLLFYQPDRLFHPRADEEILPNLYSKITDFSASDTDHYYCHLEKLVSVHRNSVEREYPLVQCPLQELPAHFHPHQEHPVFWYHQDFSPFPHPSLVYHFKSFAACVMAGNEWRSKRSMPEQGDLMHQSEEEPKDDGAVMEWSHEEQKWIKVLSGKDPLFRARIGDNDYFLFLSPTSITI